MVWLYASGIGPPPLTLLAAIVGARILLERRVDLWLILLAVLAVVAPAAYLMSGHALNQGFSVSNSAFGIKELFDAFGALVGLVGNSLYTPGPASHEFITMLLGACLLAAQVAVTIYALRLPAEQRLRFMTPLILTLYSWLVLLEIIGARLHYPGIAFTPRYSWFGLYVPVSLLFWCVMLGDAVPWKRAFGIGALVLITFGVALADAQTARQLPYVRTAFARDRATLMSLHADPTPQQQAFMFVNPPLRDFVYPDLQFLQREHLAMYEGAVMGTPATIEPSQLTVVGFGPGTIKAKTPFNVQTNGLASVWLKTNIEVTGDVFVVINGTKLKGFHHDEIVAALVPASLYAKSGVYPMYVLETGAGETTRSNTVGFVVH